MVKNAVFTIFLLFIVLVHPISAKCDKRDVVERISAELNEIEDLPFRELEESLNLFRLDISKIESNTLSSTQCAIANKLISISDDFQDINVLIGTDSITNHKKVLDIAKRIENNINFIQENDENRLLANVLEYSLKRLYETEAKFFESYVGNKTLTTPEKIELLNLSRICYQKSNNLKSYARIDFNLKMLESIYKNDVEDAEQLYFKARKYYMEAAQSDPISGYILLKNSVELINDAFILYEKHGVVPDTVYQLKNEIELKQKEFLKHFVIYVSVYGILIFSVMFVILRRLRVWMEDVEDTNLGKELLE